MPTASLVPAPPPGPRSRSASIYSNRENTDSFKQGRTASSSLGRYQTQTMWEHDVLQLLEDIGRTFWTVKHGDWKTRNPSMELILWDARFFIATKVVPCLPLPNPRHITTQLVAW